MNNKLLTFLIIAAFLTPFTFATDQIEVTRSFDPPFVYAGNATVVEVTLTANETGDTTHLSIDEFLPTNRSDVEFISPWSDPFPIMHQPNAPNATHITWLRSGITNHEPLDLEKFKYYVNLTPQNESAGHFHFNGTFLYQESDGTLHGDNIIQGPQYVSIVQTDNFSMNDSNQSTGNDDAPTTPDDCTPIGQQVNLPTLEASHAVDTDKSDGNLTWLYAASSLDGDNEAFTQQLRRINNTTYANGAFTMDQKQTVTYDAVIMFTQLEFQNGQWETVDQGIDTQISEEWTGCFPEPDPTFVQQLLQNLLNMLCQVFQFGFCP